MQSLLRIGTRSSPLALIQTQQVKDRLLQIHGANALKIDIKTITTSGDRTQKTNLSMSDSAKLINGSNNISGIFSKEIEEHLLLGKIDIGVHSAKDMVSILPDGLVMDVFLEREDARDAFISLKYNNIKDLPKGAIIGTSSIRRRAQILRIRPDVTIIEFRGNVDSRLKKLQNNIADATILAVAGLNRLGKNNHITQYLNMENFLPAPAQGAIGIEYRQNDEKTARLLAPLNHQQTYNQIIAERSFLREIDGSCRTPVACNAQIKNNEIIILGQLFSNDLQTYTQQKITGSVELAKSLGQQLAKLLLKQVSQNGK